VHTFHGLATIHVQSGFVIGDDTKWVLLSFEAANGHDDLTTVAILCMCSHEQMGLMTQLELLVVHWLAAGGLIDSPGHSGFFLTGGHLPQFQDFPGLFSQWFQKVYVLDLAPNQYHTVHFLHTPTCNLTLDYS
jgi:hypothetical protein